MFKKMISVLLAVMIVVSAMAIMSVTFNAATYNGVELESNKLYFDTNGTGWELAEGDLVSFYVYSLTRGELITWGGKKLRGTKVEGADTLWEYEPAASNKLDYRFNPDDHYFVIFYVIGAGYETYALLFDKTCLGHVAKCDGSTCETPYDSSKTSQLAYWLGGIDPKVCGPRLAITSTGNVVGSCAEYGKTAFSVFTTFLTYTGAQSLTNARQYTVDTGVKTEQKMIDDIGRDLGLTAYDVQNAFAETGVYTIWSFNASTLPKTDYPTQAYTEAPTEAPTQRPTQALTEAPTYPPTEEPTEEPTEAPTEWYTDPPTETPTHRPTQAPTEEPTEAPTEWYTDPPTEAPTQAPTEAPTLPVSSQSYTVNSSIYNRYSDLDKTFTVKTKSGDPIVYDNFIGFTVDGVYIDEENYMIELNENGSLEVTLRASYLKTLSIRKHTVSFLFTDDFVNAALTIVNGPTEAPTTPPATQSPTIPPYVTPTEREYPIYGDGCLHFDASTAGWENASSILFYIYDLEAGQELAAWGSKKLAGTKAGNIWSFDPSVIGAVDGKQYFLILYNKDTTAETYQLIFDTTCLGDTAYCTGNRIENPVDSNKTSPEAVWSNSTLGPRLAITSIGNVVGTTCPANTTKYDMFLNFLTSDGKDGLANAMNFSYGRTQDEIIDGVASGLGLTEAEKNRAKAEAGLGGGVTSSPDQATTSPTSGSSYTEPTEDSYGYQVGSYYLTGKINGLNSGTSNVDKNLKFTRDNYNQMILQNVRLRKGDVVRVAKYNGMNTFTVYPDGTGRDVVINETGEYIFYFKPYELGNANYWYLTPGYLGDSVGRILGDVDGDEVVSIIDTTFIQRYLVGMTLSIDFSEKAADADEDGDVTVLDITLIQRWLIGIKSNDNIGKPVA